jgi:hypothetical protein
VVLLHKELGYLKDYHSRPAIISFPADVYFRGEERREGAWLGRKREGSCYDVMYNPDSMDTIETIFINPTRIRDRLQYGDCTR